MDAAEVEVAEVDRDVVPAAGGHPIEEIVGVEQVLPVPIGDEQSDAVEVVPAGDAVVAEGDPRRCGQVDRAAG